MSAPLRLLLVEDSPTDAKLVCNALQKSGRALDFERVETAEALRDALSRREWDIVICDWSMPRFSALGALDVVKESALDLPFIIVSGTIGEDTAVEGMRAGAHDYVLKDKLSRLVPAVERELRERADRAARRQAESALEQAEGRFHRLYESGIIGIVTADLGGVILDANDAYLGMAGYTRAELREGMIRWPDMTPSDLAGPTERAGEELLATGIARPWESAIVRKDGRRVPVLAGVAMLDQTTCISFIADLTERKNAEAGQARAEEALRRSEQQLLQAQKMEAVGRLAGGVAHDFNNILSVILGYADLMLVDLKPADPMREDVEEVQRAAQRAAGLTNQLLMFSRNQITQPKVLDLQDVIRGMEKLLRRILGEDIDLLIAAPSSQGRVKVDPTHIEQVILNLAVNARDAMPTGGKLTIETANVDLDDAYAMNHLPSRAGPHVMLAVTDTGSGMDRATQARVFEPFFTTKGQGKGTGLGLSTVFGIIQQSGGNIWVYSEVGKGSTFKVYLPRVDERLDRVVATAAPNTLRGTETILLVEDEDQVRAVVQNILKRQGYTVIPAGSAGEALLHSEQHAGAIDLLLTDVVMPQMSGPELAKRLLAIHPEMKVLCMSGYTDDSIVRHGVLESGVAFVQKPVTPASLATRVREMLDAPAK